MKSITPKRSKECYERQSKAGRYNPASVALIHHNGRTYSCVLSAGNSDDTYFWKAGNVVECLSINHGLGYCGLQCFELGDTRNEYKPDDETRFDGDEIGSVFFQADHEIKSSLGNRGLDLSPATIRRRLSEYCYA